MVDHAERGSGPEGVLTGSGTTICATATPPGEGGVAVLRISGPEAAAIAAEVAGTPPPPRRAAYRAFRDADGDAIDRGLMLYFPAPHSYTGEEVVELHPHGSPVVVASLEHALQRAGAQPARPGEFTERAFLNGRLDLTQAEAVASLIAAHSEAAAKAAHRALEGAAGDRARDLDRRLLRFRAEVEAELDFPEEEDVPRQGPEEVAERLDELRALAGELLERARQGLQVKESRGVAVVGPPNAGKSSLVNALSGRAAAIVHGEAGTTRDVLSVPAVLGGRRAELLDTAGLRSDGEVGSVEREGHRRARDAIDRATQVLVVVESTTAPGNELLAEIDAVPADRRVLVWSKADQLDAPAGRLASGTSVPGFSAAFRVSAHTGEGLEALRRYLAEEVGTEGEGSGWSATQRQLGHLSELCDALDEARAMVDSAAFDGELVSSALRRAHEAVGAVVGASTTEDLLGEIFSGFCIGK